MTEQEAADFQESVEYLFIDTFVTRSQQLAQQPLPEGGQYLVGWIDPKDDNETFTILVYVQKPTDSQDPAAKLGTNIRVSLLERDEPTSEVPIPPLKVLAKGDFEGEEYFRNLKFSMAYNRRTVKLAAVEIAEMIYGWLTTGVQPVQGKMFVMLKEETPKLH